MQASIPRVLHSEKYGENQHQTAEIEQQPLQLLEEGAVSTVHRRVEQEKRTDLDRQDSNVQQGLGRADDFYLQTVGTVPPVVKRRGGEHYHSSPCGKEGPQRCAKTDIVNR